MSMIFVVFMQTILVFTLLSDPAQAFALELPILLGAVAALASTWSIVPRKFNEAISEVLKAEHTRLAKVPRNIHSSKTRPNQRDLVRTLTLEDVDAAAVLSLAFVFAWVVFAFVSSIAFEIVAYDLSGAVVLTSPRGRLLTCFTTPALGAILFTLFLDVARARKVVAQLAEGARDHTLTALRYRSASEIIRRINGDWQRSLYALAACALYNTVGMTIYLGGHSVSDFDDELDVSLEEFAILHDFTVVGQMGKEVMLLFLLTSLARLVNDEADDVVTDVYRWELPEDEVEDEEEKYDEEGGKGSEEQASEIEQLKRQMKRLERKSLLHEKENQRLCVVVEGANFAFLTTENPKRRTFMQRFVVDKAGGIRFRVLAIRWTSAYVQVLGISIVVSIAGVIAKRYIQDTTS
jgi:hypothetical protein